MVGFSIGRAPGTAPGCLGPPRNCVHEELVDPVAEQPEQRKIAPKRRGTVMVRTGVMGTRYGLAQEIAAQRLGVRQAGCFRPRSEPSESPIGKHGCDRRWLCQRKTATSLLNPAEPMPEPRPYLPRFPAEGRPLQHPPQRVHSPKDLHVPMSGRARRRAGMASFELGSAARRAGCNAEDGSSRRAHRSDCARHRASHTHRTYAGG